MRDVGDDQHERVAELHRVEQRLEHGRPYDMLVCMRTTINLPDALAAEAKARAASEGRTFTSLVEEGLRSVLANDTPDRGGQLEALPAFGDPNDRLLVDPADREALWAALDRGPEP